MNFWRYFLSSFVCLSVFENRLRILSCDKIGLLRGEKFFDYKETVLFHLTQLFQKGSNPPEGKYLLSRYMFNKRQW